MSSSLASRSLYWPRPLQQPQGSRASPQDRPWGEPRTCVWRLQAPTPTSSESSADPSVWICPVSWSLFTRPAQPTSGLTAECSLPLCRLRLSSVEPGSSASLRAWCGGMGTGWGLHPSPVRTGRALLHDSLLLYLSVPIGHPNACHRACLSRLLQGPGGRAWKDSWSPSPCLGPGIALWACLCPHDPCPAAAGPDLPALG